MITPARPKQKWVVQGEAMDTKSQELYLLLLTFTGMEMRPLEPVLQRFVDRCEQRWPVTTKRLRFKAESDVSETLQRRARVYRTVIDLDRQAQAGQRKSRGVAHV
jgi:hypothetical protein